MVDRDPYGHLSIPVEVVEKVHKRSTVSSLHTARNIACNLDLPKTIVLKILCSVLQMFPDRFQRVQILQLGDEQQFFDFANCLSSDATKIANGLAVYCRMRSISLIGKINFRKLLPIA